MHVLLIFQVTMPSKKFKARLVGSERLTDVLQQMSFVRLDGKPLEYRAGQFLSVYFDLDGEEISRSYSLASKPGSGLEIEFVVSHVSGGVGSTYLFGLEEGDEVTLSGPHGRFVLRDETPRRLFMVSTGTGVVPYRAMLPELEERAQKHEVYIMQGVRKPQDLLYGDELAAAAQRTDGLHFVASYSREPAPAEQEWAREGYIQRALMEHAPFSDDDLVYLCGNPAMIDSALEELKAAGLQGRRVRREKYVSPLSAKARKAAAVKAIAERAAAARASGGKAGV